MQQTEPTGSSPQRARRTFPRRWLIKPFLFAAVTVLVLNPNLKRAFLQVGHVLQPDSLIQPSFGAMPSINAQIDRIVRADRGRHSEARLVAKFVLQKIYYVSDYENWGNLDYWPTAEEAWHRGQEDCDGRAILAASILRSRGYHSAALAVSLDHMWITVDENEKDPSRPPHLVALLGPNPDLCVPLHKKSRLGDLVLLAKAFLHPATFGDASTHLFAGIPAVRKAILIVAFLLLCAHPWQKPAGALMVTALGLVSAILLANWDPDHGPLLMAMSGSIVLLAALGLALFTNRIKPSALPA
jgi:hypothetical protein